MPDADNFEALVVAKGSEVCPNVEIDDTVILMNRSGIEFDIDGEKFLSIVQEEILCAYNKLEFDPEA
jgi:co-chaperonin GroES (HSP10)